VQKFAKQEHTIRACWLKRHCSSKFLVYKHRRWPVSDEDKKPSLFVTMIFGFFKSLYQSIIQGVVWFAIGTGAGGIVCWYFNAPMIFSLLGGILVLAMALALMSDSSIF